MLTDRARVEEGALGTLVLTQRCVLCPLTQRARLESIAALTGSIAYLLIHESPLTDTLFLLVSKSDEVTTT